MQQRVVQQQVMLQRVLVQTQPVVVPTEPAVAMRRPQTDCYPRDTGGPALRPRVIHATPDSPPRMPAQTSPSAAIEGRN